MITLTLNFMKTVSEEAVLNTHVKILIMNICIFPAEQRSGLNMKTEQKQKKRLFLLEKVYEQF